MSDVAAIAQDLADHAEEICQRYLSNGKRVGRYWQVGDLANNPGRSLVVRLEPPGRGRWQDYATQERGDLLDLIRHAGRCPELASAIEAARQFLAPPRCVTPPKASGDVSYDPLSASRRLFQHGRPIKGTLAEVYLRDRGITAAMDCSALRFHPALMYCSGTADRHQCYPALLAAVTDRRDRMTGVQRTYLDPGRPTKAAVASPRKALGKLSGHGVRFGGHADILVVGEGIETVLSLVQAVPELPATAALSAGHLAAFELPPGLRYLIIAQDDDAAGHSAAARLRARAQARGIAVVDLVPKLGDFNDDLMAFGAEQLSRRLQQAVHKAFAT